MKVYVLLNEKNELELEKTISSMESQTEEPEIVKIYYSLENKKFRWKPEAKEYCKKFMLEDDGEDFVMINDAEYLNLFDTNYSDMKDYLKNNSKFGAVSLRAQIAGKPEDLHICAGVTMFRKEALKTVVFNYFKKLPSCYSVFFTLIKNGWDYNYFDYNTIRCLKLSSCEF